MTGEDLIEYAGRWWYLLLAVALGLAGVAGLVDAARAALRYRAGP